MDRPARDAIIYQWSRMSALLPLCSFSLDCLLPACLKGGTLWRWMARENISARPSADQWRCVYLPMGTMVTPYNGYLTACWPIAPRRSLNLLASGGTRYQLGVTPCVYRQTMVAFVLTGQSRDHGVQFVSVRGHFKHQYPKIKQRSKKFQK